jgi:hypothetical protein
MSIRAQRVRVSAEALLAAIFLVLFVLTTISPEWVEEVTGLEPDAGSGLLEWGLTIAFGIAALATALLARRHLRRLRTSAVGQ